MRGKILQNTSKHNNQETITQVPNTVSLTKRIQQEEQKINQNHDTLSFRPSLSSTQQEQKSVYEWNGFNVKTTLMTKNCSSLVKGFCYKHCIPK